MFYLEKFDMANLLPVTNFYSNVPMNFSLKLDGKPNVPLAFYGITMVNQGQNGGFVFTIDKNQMGVDGEYIIQYEANHINGPFSWILDDNLTVEK